MNALVEKSPQYAQRDMVLAVALIVTTTLWVYRDTALGMVDLWGQSPTFAHGYVVPLITLWLISRQRKLLAAFAHEFSPAPWALLALSGVAALWMVGDLAEVNPVRQFALVAMVVLAVPAVAGWLAARLLLFPLCFLFFAVPFGEFLIPWLMARTADFTVLALHASGIPVYRDGLQFAIPSGTWSVVETCSGVRYLIASMMVGALFAYLNYRSPKRRILFMLVALVVPIVANWLRAYMIVMIGHLSSNKLAVGVDHLIYGWVFFGVIVGLMFLIGARWAESPVDAPMTALHSDTAAQPSRLGIWLAMGAVLTLLFAPMLVLREVNSHQDQATPQLIEPEIANALATDDVALPAWTPAFLNPSATLERGYMVDGHPVGLYVGYYRSQGPGRKLVSSSNVLAKSNDPSWAVAEMGVRRVSMGAHEMTVKTARLRRPVTSSDTTTLTVRQVYWIGDRFEADDARAKAWGAWSRLLGRGDDGAVVIAFAAERSPGDAGAALDAMLREHLSAVEQQLRRARDGE